MRNRIVCLAMALLMALGTVWAFAEEATPTELENPAQEAAAENQYEIGNVVVFGSYEQDNNSDNGAEPIEWIVLDVVNSKDLMGKVDHRALLLSVNALDVKPYNDSLAAVTWKDSTLRAWLNKEFLNAAFTAEEQEAIAKSRVDNSDDQGNPAWDALTTAGNNTTQDSVFLLSYREVYKKPKDDKKKEKDTPYFADDAARLCALTDYAAANGAWVSDALTADGRPVAAWWLRSPGSNQFSASGVFFDASVYSCEPIQAVMAVRPAIWITLADEAE